MGKLKKPDNLHPRDERYLSSPGFESYMAAGGVFILGFTVSLVGTVAINQEPLFWPGFVFSIILAGVVLHLLKRREYEAKLREILENPDPDKPRRNR